jgi:uncharacterized protein
MLYSKQQEAFGQSKRGSLPRQCQECRYTLLCHGECPKNRFCYTADGESGLNYLCEGYRSFFAHTAPYFEFMKQELDAGRAPANVMNQIF